MVVIGGGHDARAKAVSIASDVRSDFAKEKATLCFFCLSHSGPSDSVPWDSECRAVSREKVMVPGFTCKEEGVSWLFKIDPAKEGRDGLSIHKHPFCAELNRGHCRFYKENHWIRDKYPTPP